MFLYHGSTVEIKEIDLSLSKPNKDFGKGFYLLTIISRPMKWQVTKQDFLVQSLV